MGKMFVILPFAEEYLSFSDKICKWIFNFLTVKKYEMYLTTIQLCSASNSAML